MIEQGDMAMLLNKPRPYDFTNPDEAMRLIREVRGYISTCHNQHHGTDFEGRQYALDALRVLCSGGAYTVHIVRAQADNVVTLAKG
jgi:hypothetical protein